MPDPDWHSIDAQDHRKGPMPVADLVAAERTQAAVAALHEHGRMPSHDVSAGLPEPDALSGKYVASVVVSDGTVVVSSGKQANPAIRDGLLVYAPYPAPGGPLEGDCLARAGTTIRPLYRPIACRTR